MKTPKDERYVEARNQRSGNEIQSDTLRMAREISYGFSTEIMSVQAVCHITHYAHITFVVEMPLWLAVIAVKFPCPRVWPRLIKP
jgi:hypothetical protein